MGDYLTLRYLLKHSGKVNCSYRERMLMTYFSALSLVASVQHALKINQKSTILKLTGILNHFAAVIGNSVDHLAVGNVADQGSRLPALSGC